MSLDVTLYYNIDHKGDIKDEWDAMHGVWSFNITHNLTEMASALGVYEALWRPEEIGIKYARDLIEPLKKADKELSENGYSYDKYNPDNDWGTREGLTKMVREYLEACKAYPNALIHISR
jgi:hypothetical protein